MTTSRLSFRTRILLVVLVVALGPLALAGLWITGSTARTGRALVESRIEEALQESLGVVAANWIDRRSALWTFAESGAVREALAEPPATSGELDWLSVSGALGPGMVSVVIRDITGSPVREVTPPPELAGPLDDLEGFTTEVAVPVWEDRFAEVPLGEVAVEYSGDAFLALGQLPPSAAGMVVVLQDRSTGRLLQASPVDPATMTGSEFQWGGERWLLARRSLQDPPLDLVVAAPLSPFTVPFREASRQSVLLILVVTALGLVLAWGLAMRLTGSLEELSEAADAVARGDLSRRVDVAETDEVGRLADAFNTMTENLERTLEELSSRESLAAVGEFAASLAHEVRNPLTAVRIDLQRVVGELPQDSPLREPQERALQEIQRLNETVERTLVAARSGGRKQEPFDLRDPLRAAAHAATPAFQDRRAHLSVELGERPVFVSGDAGALEQLALNLLLNAAQALGAGGKAWIRIDEPTDGDGDGGRGAGGAGDGDGDGDGKAKADAGPDRMAAFTVGDAGVGIPQDLQERVFEPLFTTTPEGTGLGLTIARRIVRAHGGELQLESAPGEGTRIWVGLPASIRPVGPNH